VRIRWVFGLLLIAAGVLAYANSFAGVFTFDDLDSIVNNRTIRNLRDVHLWMHPPAGGITVSGRPGLNFSLALNWAWSGQQVWSYHLVNLAGHLLAGLILFGLVRRTLDLVGKTGATAAAASTRHNLYLAWTVALLWTLHPLQTESVTYVVQRAEMLMGLCYLGTLLCFVRAAEAGDAGRRRTAAAWSAVCVGVCAVGMTCKEVMVSAPVIVFCYDRTFISGTFAAAWRRRGWFWLGLGSTWALLVSGVVSTHSRGGTAGFGVGVGFGQYLWTQGPAILRYFWLTVYPHPLVLDYGFEKQWLAHPWSALPANVLVAVLAAAALIAVGRWPRWGFLAFWFFSVLAPTSLVPGNRQSIAEHRMYLALAPLLAGCVVGIWIFVRPRRVLARVAGGVAVLIAVTETAAVRARNGQFHSDEGLWRATVEAVPSNAYAHTNLGGALYLQGKWRDARAEFLRATQLDPAYAPAESNLGMTYQVIGKWEEAIGHFRAALRINPHYAQALNNLGVALALGGRWTEAAVAYRQALASVADYPDAELNLGVAERMQRHFPAAEEHLRQAVALAPQNAEAWYDLGLAYQLQQKTDPALRSFAEAVRLKPDFANAQANWGAVLVMQHQPQAALLHFDAALALDPTNADVLVNRAVILAAAGKVEAATADYEQAIRVRPASADAWANLGMIKLGAKALSEAQRDLTEAVRLNPSNPQIRYDYGLVLAAAGDRAGATREYLETVRLAPDLPEPRNNLATQYASAGDLSRALKQLAELVRRHPDYVPAHLNLGLIYRLSGRTADAQREDDRAKELQAITAARRGR
jgi:tetratricopeptide (TPR) repeat protein